jgi:hypothetical protein
MLNVSHSEDIVFSKTYNGSNRINDPAASRP